MAKKPSKNSNFPLPGQTSGTTDSHAVNRTGSPSRLANGSEERKPKSSQNPSQKPSQKAKLKTVDLSGKAERFQESGSQESVQAIRKVQSNNHSQFAFPKRTTRLSSEVTEFAGLDHTEADRLSEHSIARRIEQNRTSLSSMMVSIVFHSCLLIALALFGFFWPKPPKGIELRAAMFDEPALDIPDTDNQSVDIELPVELTPTPTELEKDEVLDDLSTMTPALSESENFAESKSENPVPAKTESKAPNANKPLGGGLEGRDGEMRSKLAGQRGGTKASEDAVERGLKWLAAHQRVDGSWRLDLENTPCRGRCKHSGSRESSTAATGLALLAFLGAGYTQEKGPYQEQVSKGLFYLREKIRVSKFGGSLSEPTLYSHAIATMALGESYALTRDTQLRGTVESAMKFIISSQHQQGGWRYNPQQPGDMTVTGWQVMALKSCELAGFKIPSEVWQKIEQFVDSKATRYGAAYGYLNPGEEPTPTAVGLLTRMYLGWGRDHLPLNEGATWLADRGPSATDIYYDYYATLVLHHLGNDEWTGWNAKLRDHLVSTQDRRGHQNGSWHFKDKHGSVGGRLYTTAMAIMILEVYYRYLPLYEEEAIR